MSVKKKAFTDGFKSQKQANHQRGYFDKVWKSSFIEAMMCFPFEVDKMVCSGLSQLSNLRLWIDNEKQLAYAARVAMKFFCACVFWN